MQYESVCGPIIRHDVNVLERQSIAPYSIAMWACSQTGLVATVSLTDGRQW